MQDLEVLISKNHHLGTRLTLYVTRPGLVIGRKGSGIRDLTSKLEVKYGLTNPQISVVEVEIPELNPKIMCNRFAQLIERGTAFRRAALWTVNTIKNAGALGVEVTISGNLVVKELILKNILLELFLKVVIWLIES